ncbi:MAG: rhodanese-like domain-containing protein [bacterium]
MIYIDVRTKEEFDGGHVDGALHHDIMQMMQGFFPDLEKDADITLYCQSGNRAMMALGMMHAAGFTHVTNGGGIADIQK